MRYKNECNKEPYNIVKSSNSDIINFYMNFSHLKNIYRQGWLHEKIGLSVSKCESVADHSFSTCLLAMSYINKYNLGLDLMKIIKMSLIHDLCEVFVGDYTHLDNITKEEKHKLEKESIEKVCSIVEFKNDYLDIWLEYENNETEESKFLKQIDKFDFLMQAASYGYDVSHFKRSISSISNKLLLNDLEELITITKGNKIPGITTELETNSDSN